MAGTTEQNLPIAFLALISLDYRPHEILSSAFLILWHDLDGCGAFCGR
jgi:hypothetical protein